MLVIRGVDEEEKIFYIYSRGASDETIGPVSQKPLTDKENGMTAEKEPVEGFVISEVARDPDKIRYGLRLLMASRPNCRSSDLLAKESGCSIEEVDLLLTSPEETTVGVFTAVCEALGVTPNQLIGDFETVEVRSD